MDKPTFASVTNENCKCGYLESCANDPDGPIKFDKTTNEYYFSYDSKTENASGSLIIYHCIFCGGCAPRSKRDTLFYTVPEIEKQRLVGLTKEIISINDAFKILGKPDQDYKHGIAVQTEESEDSGPQTVYHRLIIYKNLSGIADINITELENGVLVSIVGKHKDH
jgi:hypothetical protein